MINKLRTPDERFEDLGVRLEVHVARVVEAELRQVDLLFVGFRLREVGFHGDVERQRRRDAVLHVVVHDPHDLAGTESRCHPSERKPVSSR